MLRLIAGVFIATQALAYLAAVFGWRVSAWTSVAISAFGAFAFLILFEMAKSAPYTAALFSGLAYAVGASAFPIGLAFLLVGGILWLARRNRAFLVLAILPLAAPVFWVRHVEAWWQAQKDSERAAMLAIRQTTLQVAMGPYALSIPASPQVWVEHPCRHDPAGPTFNCRTFLDQSPGLRLQDGLEGGPTVTAVVVRPVRAVCGLTDRHVPCIEGGTPAWCASRRDALALGWCEHITTREISFLYREDLPANPHGAADWTSVETGGAVANVPAEGFRLECTDKIWNGPHCRMAFHVAPDVRVRVWFNRPDMAGLPAAAAEARIEATRLWRVMTAGNAPLGADTDAAGSVSV